MRRRIGHAFAAQRFLAAVELERQLALRAPGRAEEAQPPPAARAEAMIGRGGFAAAGAARRQREIGKAGERGGKHRPLVPRAASLHKRARV